MLCAVNGNSAACDAEPATRRSVVIVGCARRVPGERVDVVDATAEARVTRRRYGARSESTSCQVVGRLGRVEQAGGSVTDGCTLLRGQATWLGLGRSSH